MERTPLDPDLPSYRRSPAIAFAHRGARAHAPENTLEAFTLALRLGATGLESDVWITADGEAILDHDGVFRQGLRRRKVSDIKLEDLPEHVPTLGQLYETCGVNFELSLDIKDPNAVERVMEVAQAAELAAATPVQRRLWLCDAPIANLTRWRDTYPEVRLVHSTRLAKMDLGPERCAADMAEAGLDAINLNHAEWSTGLTTLFHRFELTVFGWGAQHKRILDALLKMGVDGVFSDHVDRMMDAVNGRQP